MFYLKLKGDMLALLCFQAVLSEEELAGVEQASATAAELTGSMMRIKLELEEKKRTVNMLQTALVGEINTCRCFYLL